MQQTSAYSLKGKRIAVLMTDGVEEVEYTSPRSFLEQLGASVTLLSPKAQGEMVHAVRHDQPGESFAVEMHVGEADPGQFDALILPGGEVNPARLRESAAAIDFIRQFAREEKPIAAICHGPLALIDAGVAKASHVTSYPGAQEELRRAGAEWTDDDVVIDGRLVTSRTPEDLPAFNNAIRQLLQIDPAAADTGASS